MRSLGQNPTDEEVRAMIDDFDDDGSGSIEVSSIDSPGILSSALPLSCSQGDRIRQSPRATLSSPTSVQFEEFCTLMQRKARIMEDQILAEAAAAAPYDPATDPRRLEYLAAEADTRRLEDVAFGLQAALLREAAEQAYATLLARARQRHKQLEKQRREEAERAKMSALERENAERAAAEAAQRRADATPLEPLSKLGTHAPTYPTQMPATAFGYCGASLPRCLVPAAHACALSRLPTLCP